MKKYKNTLNNSELAQTYAEFDELVVPMTDALQSFALKMTGSMDDADDLVQETLLKAYRFFHKFEKGTNIKAWLFSIMKNSFINEYRKQAKQPGKVDYDDISNFYENIKSNEVEFSHIVGDSFSNVLDDDITQALAALPTDFQTIIILSDIEGYNYEEIAEFMSCPIGTVRSRLHRARKMMYSKLHSYAYKNGYVGNGTLVTENENISR